MSEEQINNALFEIENEIDQIQNLGNIKMIRACLEVLEKQVQEIRYGKENKE